MSGEYGGGGRTYGGGGGGSYGGERRGGYGDRGDRGGRGGYGRGGDAPRRKGLPLSELDPALTEQSRKVIGGAIEVHKALGPGLEEAVYAAALRHELQKQGVTFKADHGFEVKYDGVSVGSTTIDLFVDNRFLVSVMARPGEIGSYERAQLRSQLRVADLELGLIVNFGERRLKDGLVRVLNPDKLNIPKDDEGDEGEEDDGHGED